MASDNGNTPPTTALAVRPTATLTTTAYEPNGIEDGYRLAQYLAKSGMLGRDIKSAEQALTVMIAGRELGFTAMQSLCALYVVEGRVTLSSDAMVALVLRSPECEYLTLVESTAERCIYKGKRRGGDEVVMTFDDEDVKRAGLKATHLTYPTIMKRHRCASNICRALWPDVALGMLTPDEAREIRQGGDTVIDADVQPLDTTATEAPPAETDEARAARWRSALEAATSKEAGDAIKAEVVAALDRDNPTRKALADLYLARKAANWAPAHDAATGEVK